MSSRTFNWSLLAIGALILLSIPEATGALMGVFFGFGLAFFVAAPSWALRAAFDHYGLAVDFKDLVVGLAGLYGVIVLGLAVGGWIAFDAVAQSVAVSGWLRQRCLQRSRSWRSFL